MKALMLSGPFGEAEIAELLAALRAIEQRTPERRFRAVVVDVDGDLSLEETEQMLKRVFPRVAGEEPWIVSRRR
jgi:hypothetical protein